MGARPGISWEIEQVLGLEKIENTIFVGNPKDAYSSYMVLKRLRELIAPKVPDASPIETITRSLGPATAYVKQGDRITAITGTWEEALSKAAKELGAVEVSFTPFYIVRLLILAFFISAPFVTVLGAIWPYFEITLLTYALVAGTMLGLAAKYKRSLRERRTT